MPNVTEKISIIFRATNMLCNMLINSENRKMYVIFLSHTVSPNFASEFARSGPTVLDFVDALLKEHSRLTQGTLEIDQGCSGTM